jgi:hypothetical protein
VVSFVLGVLEEWKSESRRRCFDLLGGFWQLEVQHTRLGDCSHRELSPSYSQVSCRPIDVPLAIDFDIVGHELCFTFDAERSEDSKTAAVKSSDVQVHT